MADTSLVAGKPNEPGSAQKVNLNYNPFELRALRSVFLTAGAWLIAILGAIPLFSVIYMLVVKGGARLGLELLTELPPAGFELGGGIGNAIQGTLVTVAIASLISIPIALFAAIYLAELRPHSKISDSARFLSKVLTGFPSILAGVFVYAAVVLLMGTYSALAGGIAPARVKRQCVRSKRPSRATLRWIDHTFTKVSHRGPSLTASLLVRFHSHVADQAFTPLIPCLIRALRAPIFRVSEPAHKSPMGF